MADAEKVVLELEARRTSFSSSLKAAAAETVDFASKTEASAKRAEVAVQSAARRKAEAEERAAARIAEAAEKARIRVEEASQKAALKVEADAQRKAVAEEAAAAKAAAAAEREAARAAAAQERAALAAAAATQRKAEAEAAALAKSDAATQRAASSAAAAADRAAQKVAAAAARKESAEEKAANAMAEAAEKARVREEAAAERARVATETEAKRKAKSEEDAALREEQAQNRLNGRIANAQRNLGRQISDIGVGLAGGQSPFLILAQQAPQVADALSDTEGKAGKFAATLSGPFGAAALAAGSILATVLIPKLFASGDGVDALVKKMEEQARQSRLNASATEAFSHTLEGLADAAKKAREEAEKLNRTELENLQLTYAQNEGKIGESVKRRAEAQKALNAALREQRETQAQRDNVPGTPGAAVAQSAAEQAAAQRVATARENLATAQKEIADFQVAAAQSRIPILDYQAKATDKATAATQRQEAAVRALRDAYDKATIAANKLTDPTARQRALDTAAHAYRTSVEKANADLAKALKDIQAAGRTVDNNQIGRTVTVAEAKAIVNGIGGRVTSGYRSPETQQRLYAEKLAGTHIGPVARPGTSDHETGNAIDVAYGPGISIASIREAFRRQGVAIKQLLDEPTQRVFHVAFGDGGAARKADTDARKAEIDRERAIRDNEAYENDKQALNAVIVAAMRSQAVEAVDIAQFQRDEVEAATSRKVNAINADEAAGKYTAEQARNLRNLALQGDALQKLAIGVDLQRRQQDEANSRIAANLRNQEDVLSAQLAIADTNKQRNAIELQLLDLKYRELRQQQEAITSDTTGRYTAEQRAEAQGRLDTLPDLQRAETTGVDQRYAGPLAAYGQQLRKNTDDMNEALQGVAANGLRSLEDGLVGLISGTKNVADAFKDMATAIIADLARIVIEKAIVSALGLGLADGGLVSAPRYATGGLITGPGGPRSDSILARVSNGEFVMTAAATKRYLPVLEAMNGGANSIGAINASARAVPAGGGGTITIQVAAGEYFDARVARVSGPIAQQVSVQVVGAAAPGITKAALQQAPAYLAKSQQMGQPRTL